MFKTTPRPKSEEDKILASFTAGHRAAFERAIALALKGHYRQALMSFIDDSRTVGFANPLLMPIMIDDSASMAELKEILYYYSMR